MPTIARVRSRQEIYDWLTEQARALSLEAFLGSGLQLVAAPSVNAAFLVAAKSRRRRNQAVCQQVGN